MNFWPKRVIEVQGEVHPMSVQGPKLLPDEVVEALNETVRNKFVDILDSPVMLDDDTRLVGLYRMGADDMTWENHDVLLVITNELSNPPVLRLTTMSHPQVVTMSNVNLKSLCPGLAGKMLDSLVEQLQSVPGLAANQPVEIR